MLRKLLLLSLSLVALTSLNAQNLQLHFDPRNALYGNDVAAKNYLTATFEMFKPDAWGSTFMFVDFDLNGDKRNIGLVYAEIARAFKIKDFALMPHLEYNGGLGTGFSIPSSYLAGAEYPFQLGNFFMGTYVAYKLNAFTKLSHDVQWTLTWNSAFPNSKVSLGGFLDLWSENKDRVNGEGGKKLIMLSEPQLWYNFTSNFALGTEVELSYNFAGADKFYAIPTLATKWNF
ncbi:DUF5020 family protein [Petrimonas mucosa]|jgi:hypothetical protein|uniref:DUF5020 domain-containing protein n=1 Tax=Petrimonas mucosa TaxID=1642646 RepID=A0A1G4G481_9BACT|nr:DUF5020 family protein [Petrimonas mucosa]SCM55512.1 putative protein {ECO:0000313/EMBL:CEA16851,1} [Petrimonas mucosa]SFU41267.1 protein of unknown function [Porphyromonadaceae bacterium KHP3R9]HHT29853.1 DUF5020 family protein [Petrimonas mucosa]HOM98537.1 DUF5020 family protein [Acetomicrobium sp.]